LDVRERIKEAAERSTKLESSVDKVSNSYDEKLAPMLTELVDAFNKIAESRDLTALTKSLAGLRVLQGGILLLSLQTDRAVSLVGDLKDTLDEIDNAVDEEKQQLNDDEKRALRNLRLLQKKMERANVHWDKSDARIAEMLRRTEEMISAVRAQAEDASREAFRRKIEIYGAVVSAFVALFAGVTIVLDILRALRLVG